MEFHERFPGFSSRQECAMLYWRASCLNILAATTWFANDRTKAGICAIISEAIVDHARAHMAAIHETVGSEIEKSDRGGDER